MSTPPEFSSPREAAYDPRILVFGRLLGAANRLEYILGRALEEETGLSHTLFELLLVVGRAGSDGAPVRDIAQARVLTSGGATRLVQRAADQGLIEHKPSTADKRVQLSFLTSAGEELVLRASAVHARNIERYLVDVLPADQAGHSAASSAGCIEIGPPLDRSRCTVLTHGHRLRVPGPLTPHSTCVMVGSIPLVG